MYPGKRALAEAHIQDMRRDAEERRLAGLARRYSSLARGVSEVRARVGRHRRHLV